MITLAVGWGIVVCRLQPPPPADLGTVNSLARLQLTARRAGCELRARGADHQLRDLRDLWGWIGLGGCGPLGWISPMPPPRRDAPRDR